MECQEYSKPDCSTFNKEDNSGDLVKKEDMKKRQGRVPTKYKVVREFKSEFTPEELINRLIKVHVINN